MSRLVCHSLVAALAAAPAARAALAAHPAASAAAPEAPAAASAAAPAALFISSLVASPTTYKRATRIASTLLGSILSGLIRFNACSAQSHASKTIVVLFHVSNLLTSRASLTTTF